VEAAISFCIEFLCFLTFFKQKIHIFENAQLEPVGIAVGILERVKGAELASFGLFWKLFLLVSDRAMNLR
jgi:hypothetical protein